MTRQITATTLAGAVALLAAASACAQSGSSTGPGEAVEQGPPNVPGFAPAFAGQSRAPAAVTDVEIAVETLADGLEKPWAVATLPDGAMLVTELPGRLRVVIDGALRPEPVAGLPEVLARKQGGLLDVAPSPGFAEDRTIFWTYAKPTGGGAAVTAAARGRLSEDMTEVTDVADIFVQDPPSNSPMHYGARLAFDDQGHVYVTTGEHFTPKERVLAQDLRATYGKVIRVGLDGATPADNPFVANGPTAGLVWSYGHRNIQGAAIHPDTGELWIAEHGPQGGDELNRIEPGANYGWPIVSYGENYNGTPVGDGQPRAEGMVEPRYYWDPVIAPGGMTFYDGAAFPQWSGDLLVSGLRAGALVRLDLEGDRVVGEERLLRDHGRIRDVAIDADGAVLVVTDADNGALLRLTPSAGPDVSN